MRNLVIVLAGLFLSVALQLSAADVASPFSVSLNVIPDTTLPAIPVTLKMTFRNLGSSALRLPPHAILIAANEAGESFPVMMNSNRIYLSKLRPEPIAAGETVVLQIRPDGSFNHDPYWQNEPRLNRPGRFQLQLMVGEFLGRLLTVPDDGIRSSPVVLQVTEPTGVDLDVWREMLTIGKGQWARV